ncbi:hypothetical protein [Microlunatus spumicola]
MGRDAEQAEQQLLDELDLVERAVARNVGGVRRAHASGQGLPGVDPALLALVEREHAVLQELRRRRRPSSAA